MSIFVDQLVEVTKSKKKDAYSSDDIRTMARKCARNLESPHYQELAGNALIWDINRRTSLDTYMKVYKDLLSPRIMTFLEKNKSELEEWLEKKDSLNYFNKDFFSVSTYMHNYMIKTDKLTQTLETPLFLSLRLSIQLYDDLDEVTTTAEELATGIYIPSSPTIFNSGLVKNQLSSCFLTEVSDNLNDIFGSGISNAGKISSLGGGLGITLSSIRHSAIKGGGMSNGVLPLARLIDRMVEYADQAGKRKGAAAIFLPIWHIDVVDFIKCTDNFNISADIKVNTANTCLWMHDLFYKRVEEDGDWTMFCPAKAKKLVGQYNSDFDKEYIEYESLAFKSKALLDETERILSKVEKKREAGGFVEEYNEALKNCVKAKKNYIEHKTIKAREVLSIICKLQRQSGNPYMVNGDVVNGKSNHSNIGPINGSNLCLEIMEATPNNQVASCNLSSINLKLYVKGYIPSNPIFPTSYDFHSMGYAVRKAVKNLNKVIDCNYYPLDERDKDGNVIKEGNVSTYNKKSRPIGLGCSGLSDVMQMMRINPESEEEILMNKKIFACMYYNALLSSLSLAIEEGEYGYMREGVCYVYSGMDEKNHHVIYEEQEGSHFANGRLQFDLCKNHAKYLNDVGILDTDVYDLKDDEPLDPSEWEQDDFNLPNGDVVKASWDDLKEKIVKYGVRNSLLLALMPTASSAQALGNAESTEYHQANIYTRSVSSGHFTVVNRWLVNDLISLNLWDDDVMHFIILCGGSVSKLYEYYDDHESYKSFHESKIIRNRVRSAIKLYRTQFEISKKSTLRLARQRGIYIDQSQSTNLFISDPDEDKLSQVHIYANKLGNKVGVYYVRGNPTINADSFGAPAHIKKYFRDLDTEDIIKSHSSDGDSGSGGCIACE